MALALSDHRLTAQFLRWIRDHWLNTAAITAAATTATVIVPFIIRRLDRRRVQPGTRDTSRADRLQHDRAVMLQRVRHIWIAGVLEPSIANAPRLSIGLRKRPELCGARVHLRHPPQPLPDGKPVLAVFEEDAVGELLILGGPGSGKTTLLLELADALLRRAEHDPSQPIPIVANLESWSPLGQPFETWLADEITSNYVMARRTAETWLAQDNLTLLLDGLDKVPGKHRAACVRAINAYRREHGTVPIAVSGRTDAIEDLTVRLSLDQAVELQPLTDAQIADYLSSLERTQRVAKHTLTALTNNDVTVRKLLRSPLLRSPLLLHAFGSAYRAAEPGMGGSIEEQRQRLWRAFEARIAGLWYENHGLMIGEFPVQHAPIL